VPLGKYLFPITFVVVILLIIFFVKPEFTMTGLSAFRGNSAPYWSAGSIEIDVRGNTVVDLNNYFTDPDGDRLTYIVGRAPNVDIAVSGNLLTIYPYRKAAGKRTIIIAASDLREITSVDVVLNIN
jgi:hypothetical protein